MMKRTLITLAVLYVSAAGSASATWGHTDNEQCDKIDFEGPAAGTYVSEVTSKNGMGPILIDATNPAYPELNLATIFDSSAPTCDDFDLGTPNETFGGPGIGLGGEAGAPYENSNAQGNLLVIQENPGKCVPDDADLVGATIEVDFSALGTVKILSMKVLDIEDAAEKGATVDLLDAEGDLLAVFPLPEVGDNGIALVDLGPTAGVAKMIVRLNGSGAIDDIKFKKHRGQEGCRPCTWTYRSSMDKWQGVEPGDSFNEMFGTDVKWGYGCRLDAKRDLTMYNALHAGRSWQNTLAREATAAYLNAKSGIVDYAYTAGEVKEIVRKAFEDGSGWAIYSAKYKLARPRHC